MTVISIIAVIGKNRELGKNNQLLWCLPQDLKRFKKITFGHPVIMGRRTYESIGRMLPGRTNIIITRNKNYQASGCIVTCSLTDAVSLAKQKNQKEIFVIGGGEVYRQAIGLADRLYLTIVNDEPPADVFFPPYTDFVKTSSQPLFYNNLSFTFTIWVRKT